MVKAKSRVRLLAAAPRAVSGVHSGRRKSRIHVRLRVRALDLWSLANAINLRALGHEAPAGSTRPRPRIPLWLEEEWGPAPDTRLPPGLRAAALGRQVLNLYVLRRLLPELKRFLKQCRRCDYWFIDLTKNQRQEQCSATCRNRWWTRARRRAAGHRMSRRGKGYVASRGSRSGRP